MSFNIVTLSKDNYVSWMKQVRLILEINEYPCRLGDISVEEEQQSVAVKRRVFEGS